MVAEPVDDRWLDALDAFEAGLGHHRELLDTGDNLQASPWPPAELPDTPLPLDLRDRAKGLLGQADELNARMLNKLVELPTPAVRRPAQRAPSEHPRLNKKL